MQSVQISGASAPPLVLLQADRVRRRLSASDSVTALVATLAFGVGARDDHALLIGLVADRIVATGGRG